MIKQEEILLSFLKSYLVYHFEIWRFLGFENTIPFSKEVSFRNCTEAITNGSLLYFDLLFCFDFFEVLILKCLIKVLVKCF